MSLRWYLHTRLGGTANSRHRWRNRPTRFVDQRLQHKEQQMFPNSSCSHRVGDLNASCSHREKTGRSWQQHHPRIYRQILSPTESLNNSNLALSKIWTSPLQGLQWSQCFHVWHVPVRHAAGPHVECHVQELHRWAGKSMKTTCSRCPGSRHSQQKQSRLEPSRLEPSRCLRLPWKISTHCRSNRIAALASTHHCGVCQCVAVCCVWHLQWCTAKAGCLGSREQEDLSHTPVSAKSSDGAVSGPFTVCREWKCRSLSATWTSTLLWEVPALAAQVQSMHRTLQSFLCSWLWFESFCKCSWNAASIVEDVFPRCFESPPGTAAAAVSMCLPKQQQALNTGQAGHRKGPDWKTVDSWRNMARSFLIAVMCLEWTIMTMAYNGKWTTWNFREACLGALKVTYQPPDPPDAVLHRSVGKWVRLSFAQYLGTWSNHWKNMKKTSAGLLGRQLERPYSGHAMRLMVSGQKGAL